MQTNRGFAGLLALCAAALTAGVLPGGRPVELSLDRTSYGLLRTETGFLLRRLQGEPLFIPRALLVLPGVEEQEQETYVSSLHYGAEVDAFSIGDGQVGLHFASYEIQTEGSAQAAAGRDVFLVLDPGKGELRAGVLDPGVT